MCVWRTPGFQMGCLRLLAIVVVSDNLESRHLCNCSVSLQARYGRYSPEPGVMAGCNGNPPRSKRTSSTGICICLGLIRGPTNDHINMRILHRLSGS